MLYGTDPTREAIGPLGLQMVVRSPLPTILRNFLDPHMLSAVRCYGNSNGHGHKKLVHVQLLISADMCDVQ